MVYFFGGQDLNPNLAYITHCSNFFLTWYIKNEQVIRKYFFRPNTIFGHFKLDDYNKLVV